VVITKRMIKSLYKIFLVILFLDLVCWLGLALTSMSDDKPLPIAGVFYDIAHRVLGFPLVLINTRFPFFLEGSGNLPAYGIVAFILLNNVLLSYIILGIIRLLTIAGRSKKRD
jgi:hypothetical protein